MVKEAKEPQQKPSLEPLWDEIRKRAQKIYDRRTVGNEPGDALSDWLEAEKEIKRKYSL